MWLVWQTFSGQPERVPNQGLVGVPNKPPGGEYFLRRPGSCGLKFLIRRPLPGLPGAFSTTGARSGNKSSAGHRSGVLNIVGP